MFDFRASVYVFTLPVCYGIAHISRQVTFQDRGSSIESDYSVRPSLTYTVTYLARLRMFSKIKKF